MANRAARRQQAREQQRTPATAPRNKGGVFLAVPSGRNPELQFLTSLMHVQAYDALHSGHILGQGSFLVSPGTNVAHQRNQLVRTFLESA